MIKRPLHALHGLLAALILMTCAASTPSAEAADALELSQFHGKVVVVDFWASWCAPCRHSFPWLNEIQAKYADRGLVIIGVNVDKERADAERFLREAPAEFAIVYDPDGSLAAKFDVPGMPTSYVFGPAGELIARHIGFRNAARAERESELERLLPKTAAAGGDQH
jgi:cytochrome c biogenesis protein CcmG, thiol:disulfide interchange protein DsbE